MASLEKLSCQKRNINTKGYVNELRRKEKVPAVIYGQGMDPLAIYLDLRQINRIFQTHGSRGLFALEIEGEKTPLQAVVRETQKHPTSGMFLHIDFLQVSMSEKIASTVGIHISGEEELLKKNAILQVGLKELDISCLPGNLPETIICDVSNMEIGDKVTVGDLQLADGVEVLTDPQAMVAAILAPSRATSDMANETEEAGENKAEGE